MIEKIRELKDFLLESKDFYTRPIYPLIAGAMIITGFAPLQYKLNDLFDENSKISRKLIEKDKVINENCKLSIDMYWTLRRLMEENKRFRDHDMKLKIWDKKTKIWI